MRNEGHKVVKAWRMRADTPLPSVVQVRLRCRQQQGGRGRIPGETPLHQALPFTLSPTTAPTPDRLVHVTDL